MAETVYKCVKDGRITYTSDLRTAEGECMETIIRHDEPSPAEMARILEEKKRRQEEERKEYEAILKERELRARELEAEAASRRARAAEEELLLLRQPQQSQQPNYGYPLLYPYWWGNPIPPPHPRPPGNLRPGQPSPPAVPPRPEPSRPIGAVKVR